MRTEVLHLGFIPDPFASILQPGDGHVRIARIRENEIGFPLDRIFQVGLTLLQSLEEAHTWRTEGDDMNSTVLGFRTGLRPQSTIQFKLSPLHPCRLAGPRSRQQLQAEQVADEADRSESLPKGLQFVIRINTFSCAFCCRSWHKSTRVVFERELPSPRAFG